MSSFGINAEMGLSNRIRHANPLLKHFFDNILEGHDEGRELEHMFVTWSF